MAVYTSNYTGVQIDAAIDAVTDIIEDSGTIASQEWVTEQGYLTSSSSIVTNKQDKINAIGSEIQPIYFSALGTTAACTYSLAASVPSDAVFTDTNYYPTTFTWSNGTTAGPTGTLSGVGMNSVSFSAIPAASSSQSGIVTTGEQTFSGIKTFVNEIKIKNDSTTTSLYPDNIEFNGCAISYPQLSEDDTFAVCSWVNDRIADTVPTEEKQTSWDNKQDQLPAASSGAGYLYNDGSDNFSWTSGVGGTQLYQHKLDLDDGGSTLCYIYIISTESGTYNTQQFALEFDLNNPLLLSIRIKTEDAGDYYQPYLGCYYGNHDNVYVYYRNRLTGDIAYVNITDQYGSYDTVTPL